MKNMLRPISFFLLLCSLTLASCASDSGGTQESGQDSAATEAPKPEPKPQVLPISDPDARAEGIDVAEYQGDIDWKKVKEAGIEFAYIKASGGLTVVDVKYEANWKGASDAGLARGAYHFFYSDDDAEDQVEHFMNVTGGGFGELPPVVDLEQASIKGKPSKEEFQQNALIFLDQLADRTGCKPMVYTDADFADEWLDSKDFAEYPLWIASYEEEPEIPEIWKSGSWTLWQYSDQGSVAGIEGNVDRDKFKGGLEMLRTMGCSK